MNFKYLFLFAVLLSAAPSYASREGAQTFPATVSDGTPTAIHNSTPLTKEPNVYMEDMVVPAPKKRMAEREQIKKEISQAPQQPQQITDADIQKEQAAVKANTESNEATIKADDAVLDAPATAAAPTATPAPVASQPQQAAPSVAAADPATKRIQEQQKVAVQVRAEEARKAELEREKSHFDIVSKQHEGEVAARMKYAYEILRRFGRAYDYRVLTSRELKGLLTQLEQQRD